MCAARRSECDAKAAVRRDWVMKPRGASDGVEERRV